MATDYQWILKEEVAEFLRDNYIATGYQWIIIEEVVEFLRDNYSYWLSMDINRRGCRILEG